MVDKDNMEEPDLAVAAACILLYDNERQEERVTWSGWQMISGHVAATCVWSCNWMGRGWWLEVVRLTATS